MNRHSVAFDVIMLALPRWDGPYSSTAYSLAKEMSRYTRVYYVDNPFTLKDVLVGFFSRQIKSRLSFFFGKYSVRNCDSQYPNLFVVTPYPVLPINWLPYSVIYRFLLTINDWVFFRSIKTVLRKESVRNYVFINSFNPFYNQINPSWFSPKMTIYHCVDDIGQSKYIRKHGPILEDSLVKSFDLTVVTSTELKRLKSSITPNVYHLPNAANTELFNQAVSTELAIPDEFKRLGDKRKRILYMGNICDRIDYELLVKIAKQTMERDLVMIGPITSNAYANYGLNKMSNVIFVGAKRLEELPVYLQYSTCCIIPFLKNKLTRSIYPLKINEYLSAGKPVVTTDFSIDVMNFKDVVSVCSSHAEFLDALDHEISTDSNEKVQSRLKFSADNNWKSRAKEILNVFTNKINE